jgi:hypothetical protein
MIIIDDNHQVAEIIQILNISNSGIFFAFLSHFDTYIYTFGIVHTVNYPGAIININETLRNTKKPPSPF